MKQLEEIRCKCILKQSVHQILKTINVTWFSFHASCPSPYNFKFHQFLKLTYNESVYQFVPTLPTNNLGWKGFWQRSYFKNLNGVFAMFWFFEILKIHGFVFVKINLIYITTTIHAKINAAMHKCSNLQIHIWSE